MLNLVLNRVNISGNGLEKVKEFFRSENGELEFSLNRIVPEPRELVENPLANFFSFRDPNDMNEYGYMELDSINEQLPKEERLTVSEAKAMYQEYTEKYGTASWYNWRCKNWGCKWDVRDCTIEETVHYMAIDFQTPWASPREALLKLSKMFPQTSIIVEYADEDLGYNCGEYELLGGAEASFQEWDHDTAREFWNWDDEE